MPLAISLGWSVPPAQHAASTAKPPANPVCQGQLYAGFMQNQRGHGLFSHSPQLDVLVASSSGM